MHISLTVSLITSCKLANAACSSLGYLLDHGLCRKDRRFARGLGAEKDETIFKRSFMRLLQLHASMLTLTHKSESMVCAVDGCFDSALPKGRLACMCVYITHTHTHTHKGSSRGNRSKSHWHDKALAVHVVASNIYMYIQKCSIELILRSTHRLVPEASEDHISHEYC